MEGTNELKTILGANDLRRALAHLNARVPHRFTSLYLFRSDPDQRSFFYDSHDPERENPDGLPDLAPLCVDVRERNTGVALEEIAAEGSIRSFVGIPITDLAGNVLGSLCHFDYEPHDVTDGTAAYLERVAPLFLPFAQPAQ